MIKCLGLCSFVVFCPVSVFPIHAAVIVVMVTVVAIRLWPSIVLQLVVHSVVMFACLMVPATTIVHVVIIVDGVDAANVCEIAHNGMLGLHFDVLHPIYAVGGDPIE